jgi:hypothetical protein
MTKPISMESWTVRWRGLMRARRCASEAFDRRIVALTACVVVALP